ncbi:uncharacterized protein SOCE836_012210 [Sorangium cellulosum]|uniref:Uncharacterized protein n=1 Tax=Sorangium cellulosum TaxID=56 RepID=A0A4P2QGW9_SORCE|nr:uncharacterized protein SOCE836_012210 [Sorangium cellulosum]WCQ88525.1 hypothetical protein NQZ70_01204 [Sorangium sp. Soce836]
MQRVSSDTEVRSLLIDAKRILEESKPKIDEEGLAVIESTRADEIFRSLMGHLGSVEDIKVLGEVFSKKDIELVLNSVSQRYRLSHWSDLISLADVHGSNVPRVTMKAIRHEIGDKEASLRILDRWLERRQNQQLLHQDYLDDKIDYSVDEPVPLGAYALAEVLAVVGDLAINPLVVTSPVLPVETISQIGIELEPGPSFIRGKATEADIRWVRAHWHQPVTVAYLTWQGAREERALDIVFDNTPEWPAIEVRIGPRRIARLLSADCVEGILKTMSASKLGEPWTVETVIEGRRCTVRWAPQPGWPEHIARYMPVEHGSYKVDKHRWDNIHISHTIPIGRFLRLDRKQQIDLIPHIAQSTHKPIAENGLRTIAHFFFHFAGRNVGDVKTELRDKLTPNIKTPLDTLFQVFPHGTEETDTVKAILEAAIKNASLTGKVTLKQPDTKSDFRVPQGQSSTRRGHLSIEEKPKLPFLDLAHADIRVLIEHRNKEPTPFWRAIHGAVRKDKAIPSNFLEIFRRLDE